MCVTYGYTCIFAIAVPPSNIKITGNASVMEGGNVNLNCSAEGKPKPNITWTRLSDHGVVTMPLINISRHDVRDYRCTAENGVGTPVTRNVTIDVQCKCYIELTFESSSQVILVRQPNAYFSHNLANAPVQCFGTCFADKRHLLS